MKLRSILAATLMFATIAVPSPCAPQASTLSPEQIQTIGRAFQQNMERMKVPGATLAVARDGQLVYSRAFGKANLELDVPASTATLFRTASIAKTFTATAVMQFAEAGKLDLDAPVQNYCPAFPQKQWPLTSRQILGHLAGIRHYDKPGEASGTEHFFTLADSLRIFKDDPLKHEPGTKFLYSTFGFSVLGCVVEGVAKQPFDEYVQQNIFARAGMSHSRTDNHFLVIPGRTGFYMRMTEDTYKNLPEAAKRFARVGEAYNASLHDTSMKIPGGGFLSTSEDLVQFVLALEAGKLVKPETLEQMWTSQKTKDGAATSYGLGWNVPQGAFAGKLMLHTGGQAGTSTVILYRRDLRLIIAVMINMDDVSASRFAAVVGEIVTGSKIVP